MNVLEKWARLARYVDKKLFSAEKSLYKEQLEKAELNIPNNWKGDVRPQFKRTLEYYLCGSRKTQYIVEK